MPLGDDLFGRGGMGGGAGVGSPPGDDSTMGMGWDVNAKMGGSLANLGNNELNQIAQGYSVGDFWDDVKSGAGKIGEWLDEHEDFVGKVLAAAGNYFTNKEKNEILRDTYNIQKELLEWETEQRQKVWEEMQPVREKAMPYFESVMGGQNPMLQFLSQYYGGGGQGQQPYAGQMGATPGASFDPGALQKIPAGGAGGMGGALQGGGGQYGISPTYSSGEFRNLFQDILGKAGGMKQYEAQPFQAPEMRQYSFDKPDRLAEAGIDKNNTLYRDLFNRQLGQKIMGGGQ